MVISMFFKVLRHDFISRRRDFDVDIVVMSVLHGEEETNNAARRLIGLGLEV